jgi:hypothetical protein
LWRQATQTLLQEGRGLKEAAFAVELDRVNGTTKFHAERKAINLLIRKAESRSAGLLSWNMQRPKCPLPALRD